MTPFRDTLCIRRSGDWRIGHAQEGVGSVRDGTVSELYLALSPWTQSGWESSNISVDLDRSIILVCCAPALNIEVLHNTHPERARLSGIDCPEKGQAFGTRAKQALSALVFGRDVILQTHGQDKYRRTLADVFPRDGTNVNHELVKNGWCWWYRKYASGNVTLEQLETKARDAKRGLWADPHPIPPWEWRKKKLRLSTGEEL